VAIITNLYLRTDFRKLQIHTGIVRNNALSDFTLITSSCKVPVIPVRFLMKLVFYGQIFEKYSNIKFHKNPSVEAELLHADGRKYGQTCCS